MGHSTRPTLHFSTCTDFYLCEKVGFTRLSSWLSRLQPFALPSAGCARPLRRSVASMLGRQHRLASGQRAYPTDFVVWLPQRLVSVFRALRSKRVNQIF